MQKIEISVKQSTEIAKRIHADIFTYCNLHADRFEKFKRQLDEEALYGVKDKQ
jgi:hypothetical protein